ncbi:MAG TPA: alanine racemase [Candidatus Binataceae bacterium]|nr:alanine racemase [Candidatus Binataceae bacterium]
MSADRQNFNEAGTGLDGGGRPTVAEIDLAALRSNYHALRRLAPRAQAMAVLKADAYGHGAPAVARALAAEGCAHFGVATLGEAQQLRQAGLRQRIYVMGGFFPEEAPALVQLALTPFVFDRALLMPLERAAAQAGIASFPIHLKLDTGATRLGVLPADLPATIDILLGCRHLNLEGVCTLLASAGDPSSPVTDAQLTSFRHGIDLMAAAGLRPAVEHVANSAATVLRYDSHLGMIRLGLALYGLPPVPSVAQQVALRPVMTFKTRILQVKQVPAGTGVSYGHTFITARDSRIGVLPVGYADGYRRGLQNGGEVLVGGGRAPVVGAVCMDLTMVDLTDLPAARVGDSVVLWGGQGPDAISANDVARLVQTISYELLCGVGRRVPRLYLAE